MAGSGRAAVRNVVLIVVAIGLLITAGLAYRRASTPEPPPADEFIGFYCPACEHSFQLSHRDFEAVWDRGEFSRGADGRRLLFKCPKCGKLTAERAERSPAGGSARRVEGE